VNIFINVGLRKGSAKGSVKVGVKMILWIIRLEWIKIRKLVSEDRMRVRVSLL
jgi:hypothetical protein